MLFNTVQYLMFLPIVVAIYYILPRCAKYIWLLAASYFFYMQWNAAYILLLFLCTMITYIGGLAIQGMKKRELLYKYARIGGGGGRRRKSGSLCS